MDTIANILQNAPTWLTAIMALVTACTAISALTPTKVDDEILGGIGKVINILLRVTNIGAGNVFKNKNADDK